MEVAPDQRVYGEERRHKELLAAFTRLQSLLMDFVDQEAPEPVVNVAPPDLSSLVLPIPEPVAFDPDALAEAIARRLPADRTPEVTEAFKSITTELKGIGKKLKALGMPILTGGNMTVANDSEHAVPVEIVGGAGSATEITNDAGNPIPVSGTVTVNEPVTVDGTVAVSGTVPVSGTFFQGTQPVSGTVTATAPTGTLNNGAETTLVAATPADILAANANRRKLIIQNTGSNPMRVGTSAVGLTTGLLVAAGGTVVLDPPYCPTNVIRAVSALGTTAFAMEVM